MKKKETMTAYYEHCGECPNCNDYPDDKYRCIKGLKMKRIKDLWGEIPDWCPLEMVEEK